MATKMDISSKLAEVNSIRPLPEDKERRVRQPPSTCATPRRLRVACRQPLRRFRRLRKGGWARPIRLPRFHRAPHAAHLAAKAARTSCLARPVTPWTADPARLCDATL